MSARNLAVLAVRAADPDRLDEVVAARRGTRGEAGGVPLATFPSPTDAVLAGLDLTARPSVAAAVSLGEVVAGGADLAGAGVAAALALLEVSPAGTALLAEGVYLAMNRNEVSAEPAQDVDSPEEAGSTAYRARARRAEAPAAAPAPTPAAAAPSVAPLAMALAGVLAAFGLGQLAGQGGAARAQGDLAGQAEVLASKGQHRAAAAAFLAAYRRDPGQPLLEARFRETTLAAVDAFEKAGRLDAAFGLLSDALAEDPYRPDLEDRLVDLGEDYAEALLTSEARTAYATMAATYLRALPLREAELRDRLLGLEIERVLRRWRGRGAYRNRYPVFEELNAIWKRSEKHPRLLLAWVEVQADQGHGRRFLGDLEALLEGWPEAPQQAPELLEAVELILKKLDQAGERKAYLGPIVEVCAQRFPAEVEPVMRRLLVGDHVGGRVAALQFFDRRGGLDEGEALEAHLKNLRGLAHVGSRESPLKDPRVVDAAADFAADASAPARSKLVAALDAATRMPDTSSAVQDRIQAALQRLET